MTATTARVGMFRGNAEIAERLANQALDPLERDAYRKIAEGWWDLAQAAMLAKRPGPLGHHHPPLRESEDMARLAGALT
jgi:hypothetical protein